MLNKDIKNLTYPPHLSQKINEAAYIIARYRQKVITHKLFFLDISYFFHLNSYIHHINTTPLINIIATFAARIKKGKYYEEGIYEF